MKATLRTSPSRIVIGEVRDASALDFLDAAVTGHPGGLCTVHASSALGALRRLDRLAQRANVPPQSTLVAEAIDLVLQSEIDVVVSDIGMPEQDGFSLIEAVRALQTPEAVVPAVAVTAYVSSRDRARAFSAGYGWHVAKPVDPDQLVAVVTAAARSHPTSQPS